MLRAAAVWALCGALAGGCAAAPEAVKAAAEVGGGVAGVGVKTGAKVGAWGLKGVTSIAGGILSVVPIIGEPLGNAVAWTGRTTAEGVSIIGEGAGDLLMVAGDKAIYLTELGAWTELAANLSSAGRLATVAADTVAAARLADVAAVADVGRCFLDKGTSAIFCAQ